MALFSKSIESAQTAVTKAAAVVTDWEAKAAAARAEASRIDSEAGAAILADESAAERITLQVQSQERKARAYDQAAEEARRKLHTAQREALEAEAREEDKQAAAARKAAEAHDAKVDALLAQLKDIDGCDYEPGRATESWAADQGLTQIPAAVAKWDQADQHEVRAAVIRYYIATAKVPADYYELNIGLGTSFPGFGRSIHDGDRLPKSVYAARDAGLSFVGA
ncbi:hypothetical protein [Crystallibacter degradans]|uniref:hypothetical protein n=1 Tax=Crystallibacter degradans TaxID=2726743 RepID=UPI001473233E|nr:hypothetical protein [Arthrobacter sp. SF27]NMR29944.1 hypothetical protein [Arthrobacter sp. SF27]